MYKVQKYGTPEVIVDCVIGIVVGCVIMLAIFGVFLF